MFEYGSLNGGEFSLLCALDALAGDDIHPITLCPSGSPLAKALEQRGIEQHDIPPFPSGPAGTAQEHAWEALLGDLIRNLNLHLLHANSLTMSRRLGRVSARLPCPTTGHVRDIMKLSGSAVAALEQHQGLVAVSQAVEQSLLSQGVPAGKIHCIYNGVDLVRFRPREKEGKLLRELSLPVESRLAATIGQICLRKGQNDLAAAAVLLKDRFPHLHFLLVGQRHSAKQESLNFDEGITQAFRQAGMAARLHRLEFREEIPEILNEIDLLIHPARQEPLGRVLLEAAASGCPIIATDVGGTSEILAHGATGWLVPPALPAALADGVARLLADPALARHLGAAARREMEQRFSARPAAKRLLKFWKTILADSQTISRSMLNS